MLSIITPCFNAARFLPACLEHVARERLPDMEHVVVDGGSTDGSDEILRDAAARLSHLRFVSARDRGQSDAMNRGLALARHDFVTFLNVDDYFEPGALRRVAAHPAAARADAFIVGACNLRGPKGERYGTVPARRLDPDVLMLDWHRAPFPANPSAYFYDRRLHRRIGPYDEALRYTMDLDFLLRALRVADVHPVPDVLGNFVLHPDCKTVHDRAPGHDERIRVFERHRRARPVARRLLGAALAPLVQIDNAVHLATLQFRASAGRAFRRLRAVPSR
jgi:glycosyltransferase involved in cell wall biosynthesis